MDVEEQTESVDDDNQANQANTAVAAEVELHSTNTQEVSQASGENVDEARAMTPPAAVESQETTEPQANLANDDPFSQEHSDSDSDTDSLPELEYVGPPHGSLPAEDVRFEENAEESPPPYNAVMMMEPGAGVPFNFHGWGEAAVLGIAPQVPVVPEYIPSSPDEMQVELSEPDDSLSSDVVFNDAGDDASANHNWNIPQDHVHAAIRELISQSRRSQGGFASILNQDNFMHRLRRVIFSLHHTRRNRGEENRNNGSAAEIEDVLDSIRVPGPDSENIQQAEEQDPENAVRFDTNLPAEHSYFGFNMNRVSGVNYLDVGVHYNIMLFMHQHILFPGEVLPFMVSASVFEADIDSQNGLLFGVCFPGTQDAEEDEVLYGVTCQIYEKGNDAQHHTLVKSRVMQRFVTRRSKLTGPLQYIISHPQIKCYGEIKILPEIYLPEPLKCIQMGSLARFRDIDSMSNIYKRYQASTTPWPAHVYENYNMSAFVEKARAVLASHKIDTMPMDPVQLSYWLVRNLHLSESMQRKIFTTDSVNVRMKLISTTFKEDAVFICRYCANRIANCRELFAMSKHGVQTQYCNSAGYIHETNTVYHLIRDSVMYSGEPSTEFSWFPGYQWHIILCNICSRHIGWEFKAVEPNLVPKSFFGISSSSVRVSAATHVPSDPRAVIYTSLARLAGRDIQ